MLTDLSRRSSCPELMDGENVDYETFRGCLRDLARVNVLSLGYRPTLAFLDRLRRSGRLRLGRPVEILDVGSGYGDLLRAVDRWAIRHGLEVRLTGIDLSPWSARAAREATAQDRPFQWLTGDIFEHFGQADIVCSSLLAHHLPDAGVVRFLRWMEDRAGVGWFVNDLHRHPVPYLGFGPLAAAMRLHPFVRHDGPASFARAFRMADWHTLLAKAGVPATETSVRRWAPFRICVARVRTP
jgi:SAM-dependent methyltransferase